MTHPVRGARRTGAVLAVAALAATTSLTATTVLAAPAVADGSYADTQWYYTNFNMAGNAARASGAGVTLAVIDGGPIDTSVPELAGATIVTQPQSPCYRSDGTAAPAVSTGADASHSTSIAVMLVGNGTGNYDGRGGTGVARSITLQHYRVGVSADPANPSDFTCHNATGGSSFDNAAGDAIDAATRAGARVISLSYGGRNNQSATANAIGRAESKGVVVVAGTADKADDGSGDERVTPPSYFNGVLAVNGIKSDSSLSDYSADSSLVAVAGPGTNLGLGAFNPATGQWDSSGYVNGSSFATPWVAGVIAAAMSAFPQATSNQILQLMFRTTGGTVHDLVDRGTEGLGFGVPSLTTMLENDPSTLPDENPLLRDGVDPATSEILGTGTGTDGGSTSPAPSTADSGGASSGSAPAQAVDRENPGPSFPWWLIGVLAVVALVAVLIVLVVRRRGASTGPPSPPPPPPYVRT